MKDKIISPKNISSELLKQLFEDAYLDASIDKKTGNIIIKENWSTWIYIDEEKRYFSFNISFTIKKKSKLVDRVEYTHNVSKEFILIKAYNDNGGITFSTYIWLEGGVTPKNIIKTYKAFVWVTGDSNGTT